MEFIRLGKFIRLDVKEEGAKPRFSVLRDLLCGGTISRLGRPRSKRICLGGGRDD